MNPEQEQEKRWNVFVKSATFCLVVLTLSFCFWIVWSTVSSYRHGKAQDFAQCAESCSTEDSWWEDGKKVFRETPGNEAQDCQDRCYQLLMGVEDDD